MSKKVKKSSSLNCESDGCSISQERKDQIIKEIFGDLNEYDYAPPDAGEIIYPISDFFIPFVPSLLTPEEMLLKSIFGDSYEMPDDTIENKPNTKNNYCNTTDQEIIVKSED